MKMKNENRSLRRIPVDEGPPGKEVPCDKISSLQWLRYSQISGHETWFLGTADGGQGILGIADETLKKTSN